jgi:hypothetical protein
MMSAGGGDGHGGVCCDCGGGDIGVDTARTTTCRRPSPSCSSPIAAAPCPSQGDLKLWGRERGAFRLMHVFFF